MSEHLMSLPERRAAGPKILPALLLLIAVSLCLVVGFAYLGQEVREPATTSADQSLLRRVADQTRPWSLTLPETVSLFGTAPLVSVVTAVVCASLARQGRWFDIALLIAAMVGAVLLSPVTKHLVSRARPTAFFRTSATGYSFPSGHTLNATCLALALGFILWRLPWHRTIKVLWMIALVVYAACVGASRVILGVHYPTDVLGGFLLGGAWATFLMAVVIGMERWRVSRRRESGGRLMNIDN